MTTISLSHAATPNGPIISREKIRIFGTISRIASICWSLLRLIVAVPRLVFLCVAQVTVNLAICLSARLISLRQALSSFLNRKPTRLAATLPEMLANEHIGSHYHYGEFLLRKTLVTRAMTELAARSENQDEQDLSISEIDSYDRAIKRRWTVQADTFQFDLGLSGSELVVLASAEREAGE